MCRSWLERQQNCPTCRASVIAPQPASQAPAGQAGAPAAAGDPAAPAGVSPIEAYILRIQVQSSWMAGRGGGASVAA